jgi:hypothetical protein
MTTGALIFAFNNEKTDYVAMARWSAQNIRRHLDIPVAIVTDADPADPRVSGFDQVITAHATSGGTRWFEDYQSTVTWHNAGRVDAYNLSPWDHTLVLDADYVVASDKLKLLLSASQDFLAHRSAFDLVCPDASFMETFGRNRFPMWWATVMMFRKSNTAQYIFESMTMIRQNWQHYRNLYGITEKNYRNDYALSIALGIVSGHTLQVDSIPWKLASVMPETEVEQLGQDYFSFKYKSSNNVLRTLGISGTDFHAMGKSHLEKIIATH